MMREPENKTLLRQVWDYFLNLRDQSPFWRTQAWIWGLILVIVIAGGGLFAVFALNGVFGGGNIFYEAKGSPGPVTFRHYSHMWFENGKYKACKKCHDNLFAPQGYGTFVIRALKDSPDRKIRIGKDASTLYMPIAGQSTDAALVTYSVPRACKTCATGACHDGKESFSRFQCLGCHKRR